MSARDPNLPSPEYMRGRRWIKKHLDELVMHYPNAWVAVYNDRVVVAGPELGEVQTLACQSSPRFDIAYQFVDDGSLIY